VPVTAPPPVCVSRVAPVTPATELLLPGTTVRPVAPGLYGFAAWLPVTERVELYGLAPGLTSPVCVPDAAWLSAVPGEAVTERLTPWLFVVSVCANAPIAGAATIDATKNSVCVARIIDRFLSADRESIWSVMKQRPVAAPVGDGPDL
jgi:hypothetical protein